ncbi:PEP-CTERM/exosortase system-associated acyltransferase [Thalassomonas actiniarum]|uniref:PEP-CTERM/exosortase system-associated acyltransferase n=1 Tax=Thalassomonas actiniarum TaxID=485447 RepID=A0AAE9YTU2_9GAMM|nr:PEP-CTERM/exosortase system-associated acyltransferase [Thalassomonas actiniarum]WDD99491.1 PEP-CTERM/exosortase system-associated acyltransferase [Thalassomonas actiniarum]
MSWNKRLLNTPIIGDITKKIASMKVSNDAKNIAEHFTQFLKPELATTDELRAEVFKIRHNVYCEELAFEEVKAEGQEKDEFDDHSIFSMIKHKPSSTYTSCVRVVRSSSEAELLPIEKYCLDSIQNESLHPSNFKRTEICEISRLAVKADFRRRKSDQFKGSAIGVISESTYSETELRCFPFIAIGLYMAAATLAIDTGIKHVYVMMEPRLARSMKFVGINFHQLGDAIDYHGLRAPYYINPKIFMDNLTPGFKSLFKAIENDICEQLSELKLI